MIANGINSTHVGTDSRIRGLVEESIKKWVLKPPA
jgi:hypothetical protein